MSSRQTTVFKPIEPEQVVALALEKKAQGWRFVECHANRPYKDQGVEVIWSFANDEQKLLECYEAFVPVDGTIKSLSQVYPCAFIFENEMHDLFGITVENLSIDYQGGFYRLHYEAPMLSRPGTRDGQSKPTGWADEVIDKAEEAQAPVKAAAARRAAGVKAAAPAHLAPEFQDSAAQASAPQQAPESQAPAPQQAPAAPADADAAEGQAD